ncbi:hypothetical protein AMECASPLE_000554 [Ameca splendens]|uniref:Uncharacterized protein n=1 Tax=Ameca splendens TaxID=208324 RepID=A0ABV0YX26_9TELE
MMLFIHLKFYSKSFSSQKPDTPDDDRVNIGNLTPVIPSAIKDKPSSHKALFFNISHICFDSLTHYMRGKYVLKISQSFSTAYSIVGCGGAGVYLQQSMGERQGTPWTGRQSIAGQHTNNHAHTHSYT